MRVLLVTIVLMTPVTAFAQVASLVNTRSWRCDFPTAAVTDWLEERAEPEVITQNFTITIDNVDAANGTARIIGDTGASDLIVVSGAGVLHFLEGTGSGNMNVTTIFNASTPASQLKAVHSRHVLILGDPLPSQAYGYCRPWEN